MVCGDFNARCGGLSDVDGEPSRCCVDLVKNSQGELLVDCMRSSGLVFVNGRQGRDQFTCISSRGRSVVDYWLVPEEELMSIRNFDVQTMSQCEEELCGGEEGYRITDNSVLLWDITETHVTRFHSQGIIARQRVDSVCWIYIICIQQLLLANIENFIIHSYSYINEHGSDMCV